MAGERMRPAERGAGVTGGEMGPGVRTWSVSRLTDAIRDALERRFDDVWVEGEVTNFRGTHEPSGHLYFALRDERAVVNVVMFRREATRLRAQLEDGTAVLARGRLTVYPPRGHYQLILDRIEPVGVGALMAAFEEMKRRLGAEGLFDPARKRPLPRLPRRIGIVTSPAGAAVRDLVTVIRQRAPRASILICPARVQGPGAAEEIAGAIRRLACCPDVDVIVAGRGGGSIEDLWAFNEEAVARAIHASPVPIVSAVGHEMDFTIADFVADVRAATPSHAGEIIVPAVAELHDVVRGGEVRLHRAARACVDAQRRRVLELSARLVDPRQTLARARLRLDELDHRMVMTMHRRVGGCRERVAAAVRRLESGRVDPRSRLARHRDRVGALERAAVTAVQRRLHEARYRQGLATSALHAHSPLAVLARGYAVAYAAGGAVLRRADQVAPGDEVTLQLQAGRLTARVMVAHMPGERED